MSMENRDQRIDQLLKGIQRLCSDTDKCYTCPFYKAGCVFDEPKPRTWWEEDSVVIRAEPSEVEYAEKEVIEKPEAEDDSEGTWLVSTTMGSVFSKYVYICSKCGYKKESVLSLTPMTKCPECEKRKAARA